MDEERKVYDVVGEVRISTTEYRDLIEDRIKFEKSAEEYRSKTWRQESEISELKKQIETLQNNYTKVADFIKSDTERYQAYVRTIAGNAVEL